MSFEDIVVIPADAMANRHFAALRSRWFVLTQHWERRILMVILLLSATLNLVGIEHNGLGNTYYAVTVHSMMQSWHNWFFAAFDPGGFVSVDKPPLGFWIQSMSVWLFGFNGTALALPQAIAGVISVWLLYQIVSKHFGTIAGLISAGILAISPISVATNRSNILESLLVLLLLAATYATSQAMQRGSLRWLVLSSMFLGLAFNVKMLEAYLILPALGTAYFLTAPIPWRARIGHLLAAGGVLIAVSFAWLFAVMLTPSASRPYIGSSYHNSEFDLLWLYNGIQRFSGTPWTQPALASDPQGVPGPLRLVIPQLAGQSGWLLPLALAMLSLVASRLWRSPGTRLSQQQGSLVLWGLWLVPMVVFFSMAHLFNVYYLALLSPAIAALVGIGVTTCWTAGKAGRWEGWVLGAGVIATVGEAMIIVASVPFWNPWLIPLSGLLLAIFLTVWWHVLTVRVPLSRALQSIAAISLAGALCLTPLLWTMSSLHPDIDAGFPRAGPIQPSSRVVEKPVVSQQLLAYLRHYAGSTRFLVATVDVNTAIPFTLATDLPVMAMGGYTGFDPILTPATLSQRIANHTIRFFYLPASNLTTAQVARLYPSLAANSPHFTNMLTAWVAQTCHPVPADAWSPSANAPATTLDFMQLWDCDTQASPPY